MSMAFFYSFLFFFFLTNFEIKNKHFLDTSPGYESVPAGPHPNQERWQHSDNRISRKRGGKKWLQDVMLPPQQGATRAQLLARDWRVGPAVSVLAGMKERRLETGCFWGFIWEHRSYFDRVLCQTSPTSITHFQQKHALLPTLPPAQGTRGRVTRYKDLVVSGSACSPLL